MHPLVDQLERGLRFGRGDSGARKLEKLEAMLAELGLPVSTCGPILASLLLIPMSGRYPALELEPHELRQKTFQALMSVYKAMAASAPLLVVAEDVHWMDPSTQEFFALLIEQIASLSVFMVIVHRVGFDWPWGEHAHVTRHALNRLGRRECVALIEKITVGQSLPTEVVEQIVARTDGIPLFVEELTKTVVDSALTRERGVDSGPTGPISPLVIPASLQDALMARLDRLGRVKELAQVAATIGRSFSHESCY